MSNSGVATRRIRKRARSWRSGRPVEGAHVERIADEMRRVAAGCKIFDHPPLSAEQLRRTADEQLCEHVRGLRSLLRSRLREPRMAPYYRGQVVLALNALRQRRDYAAALEIVCGELAARDINF